MEGEGQNGVGRGPLCPLPGRSGGPQSLSEFQEGKPEEVFVWLSGNTDVFEAGGIFSSLLKGRISSGPKAVWWTRLGG